MDEESKVEVKLENSPIVTEDKALDTAEEMTDGDERSETEFEPKRTVCKVPTRQRCEDLDQLGLTHSMRFQDLGKLEDLERSLEHFSRALELTPDGHPDMPMRLASLAVSYNDRYRRLGEAEDLDKSLECGTRALELTPDGHPDMPDRLASLAVSYTDRYRRLGKAEDLDKSLEHRIRALGLTPDGHPDMPKRLSSLAVSYSDRYRRLGEAEDLNKSLEHFSRALDLTPDGHPDMPDRLANLAVSYSDRYQRLGEAEDLNKSLEHRIRALGLTPDGHPNMPKRLSSLAVSYGDRYRRLGEAEDLDKSLEFDTRALESTPAGHPDMPGRLSSLAVSYGDRYRRLGEAEDLDKSLECDTRALELTPAGHPDMPMRLANLAVSFEDRYRRLGEAEDLNNSLEHRIRALELTPSGHPDLSARHHDLALSQLQQFQSTGDFDYSNRSLLSFRNAAQLETSSPRERFRVAREWVNHASTHAFLNLMEAYQVTLSLLPEFVWLGATTVQRYHDLSMVEHLAVNAACVAILASEHSLALEWLEHARCVVWNQSLTLRSPLDPLHSSHPALAVQLQAVSDQLHSAGFGTSQTTALTATSITPEQVGNQRRRLAAQYRNLLAHVRRLPGFQDFLTPMKASSLTRAARHGPIAVINCHKDRCDALLILPGQEHISHLQLPYMTQEKAQKARLDMTAALRQTGLRERGVRIFQEPAPKDRIERVLATLWNDIVKPVLDFLGYTNGMQRDSLPHITWCPTGPLSFLPLHAAGDYKQTGSRVFDYVISSYTPTLTALLASTANTRDSSCRILAVGQANTPHRSPLPGTVEELAYLKAHARHGVEYSQLTDHQATTAAVLDAMEQYDWVHLACHAHQDIQDPTKSGFFLHDGTLDLASISRRSFKNKGLAFLSACQTATGDEKLPDEAIHLASGMLIAGYPSVIATMWSVSDSDAPLVANKVYAQLIEDGKIGNGKAGRALHYAVAVLREKVGETEYGRWVPYIHIGS